MSQFAFKPKLRGELVGRTGGDKNIRRCAGAGGADANLIDYRGYSGQLASGALPEVLAETGTSAVSTKVS